MDFNGNRRFGPPRGSFNNGFFANEAYRAGGYYHPHFPVRDFIGGAPDEALRWEIERQRIRAEMIEADMAMRRQIEEEVRRELAIEREIALQRTRGFTTSQEQIRSPNSPIPEVRTEGRFPLGSRPSPELESVSNQNRYGSGDSDGRQNPAPEDTEKSSAVVSTKPPSTVTVGVKRKESLPSVAGDTAEPAGNDLPWLAIPRKKTKTTQCLWVCTLCNISCTSSDGLDDHRLGKKHMRNVAESEAKTREIGSSETDEKALQTNLELGKKHMRNVSESKAKTREVGSSQTVAKALQTNVEQSAGAPSCTNGNAEESKTPPKRSGPKKKFKRRSVWRAQVKPENTGTRFRFWCESCGVQCNSAAARDGHLGGKKHRLSTNNSRHVKNHGGNMSKNSIADKNDGDDDGIAIRSVEIEVKQPDQSGSESIVLVPKAEDVKENGGSSGNEGDVLDDGAIQPVEIEEVKQPDQSGAESIVFVPKSDDVKENGGSEGDVLDGGAIQPAEIEEVKQPDRSVAESLVFVPKSDDVKENGGSSDNEGDVLDGVAILSVEIEEVKQPDRSGAESIVFVPKSDDVKENGGSSGNERDMLDGGAIQPVEIEVKQPDRMGAGSS